MGAGTKVVYNHAWLKRNACKWFYHRYSTVNFCRAWESAQNMKLNNAVIQTVCYPEVAQVSKGVNARVCGENTQSDLVMKSQRKTVSEFPVWTHIPYIGALSYLWRTNPAGEVACSLLASLPNIWKCTLWHRRQHSVSVKIRRAGSTCLLKDSSWVTILSYTRHITIFKRYYIIIYQKKTPVSLYRHFSSK